MDVARPYADVIPGPRGRLLITLVQLEAPVTVRALARHANLSPQGALGYINELTDAGIVLAERAGPSIMVSLNRQHLAVEPLVSLAYMRGRLVDKLREELERSAGLAGAWLFGSTARGDGGRDSDVDVLLVFDETTETTDRTAATSALRQRVYAWTGNELQLVEHSRVSFASLVAERAPLVTAIRSDGIPLTEDGRQLLGGAA